MADTSKPQGPFKLVTVNTAPERAKRLIGRVVEDVKAEYTIIYAANAESKSALPSSTISPPLPGMISAAADSRTSYRRSEEHG